MRSKQAPEGAMNARLTARFRAISPNLGIQDTVRASLNPAWIMQGSTAVYAAAVFFLRFRGLAEERFVFAFPALIITYLLIARRFRVAGSANGVYLFKASRIRAVPVKLIGRVPLEEIELIETSMVTDRWSFGEHALAIPKKHRQKVIEIVGHANTRASSYETSHD